MEGNPFSVTIDESRVGIEIHFNRPEAAERLLLIAFCTAEHRLDASYNLLRIEGFDDIIVRTEAKSAEPVYVFGQRGHHDDRRVFGLSQTCKHGKTIKLGNANIEQNDIRRQQRVMLQRRFAIGGPHRAIALPHEIGIQDLRNFRLILHNKNETVVHWRLQI